MGISMSQPSNKSMVDELVERHHYIISPNVEGAFRAVDRAMYFNLTGNDAFDPYSEAPWRQHNLHLSAPCIYAKAVEALDLQPGHSFLNLGSGTGYLNTIVGLIIGPNGINHGIEYHSDVVEYAQKRLERFKRESFAIDKYDFAEPIFIHGDCVKLNPNARYDRVYLGAACLPELESFMKKLVKPAGGVLVMPLDCFLLRYIRITEVEWKVEKLMQVSFTLMIREPLSSEDDNKMIDMPLARPKSLKELCRIRIRQHLREKTNLVNPKLLNSDNVEARRIRKARAERKMLLKQEREFRRRYKNACPCAKDTSESNGEPGARSHKPCRRWPCREFSELEAKVSGSDSGRMMTRSARKRFELSRLFNRFRSSPSNDNSVSGQLRGRDQNNSESDSSSSDNRSATLTRRNSGGPVSRGEGCSRTRPFVSRLGRHSIREQAPSPARLGEPYRITRSAFPASRRADIRRIIDSSYCPVFMSSPSTASTHSDSSSSSSMRQNDDEDYNRRPILPDFPSLLRLRRRALGDMASRAIISSIFEPISDDPDAIEASDSDYEEESDDGDSFDDDFNDPDLSGLESFEDEDDDEEEDTSDASHDVDDQSGDSDDGSQEEEDDDDNDASSGESSSWRSFLETLNEDNNTSTATRPIAPSYLPSQAAMKRYQSHTLQRSDRKRKRRSSSSSCSEASSTSSPNRRGRRNRPSDNIGTHQQNNSNHHEAGGQTTGYRLRRRCDCSQRLAAKTTDAAGGSSSLSSHGDQLAPDDIFETATSGESDSSSPRTSGGQSVENPPESSHRWTRLRSLISARVKPDARSVTQQLSCPRGGGGGATQSSTCLLDKSDKNNTSGGDIFDVAGGASSTTRLRQSDRSQAQGTTSQQATTAATTELDGSDSLVAAAAAATEAAATRCSHHRHHCHSHGHARHGHRRHHQRYCCGKCSRHRVTASSSNQQSGSAEIESLSSPAAATSSPAASRRFSQSCARSCSSSSASYCNRETCGPSKNGDESEGKQQQQQRKSRSKKNERRMRNESECQRYHNHLSAYISQLPVPRVLQNYLNFDRGGNI